MIIHDHYDALLTQEVVITADDGGETISAEGCIDLTETGGVEHAQLVLTADACEQALTLQVTGSATKEGEFTPVDPLIFTTTPGEPFAWRDRIPLHCPQYVRLQVRAGEGAPAQPVVVRLRAAV